ncbi:MAG: helicase HerA-like domain-containing protein [Rickettsiales bacterium]
MILENGGIYLGKGDTPANLLLKYANRHGLIAGATGTGKTLTLQGLAEGFSQAGVSVFIADVKGDLSGLAAAGADKPPLVERAKLINFSLDYAACPTIFWDVFGKNGHPLRGTISEMGPLMLSRLLDLNDTQEGVLTIAFRVADDEGLLLLDLDDLRAMLTHVSENAAAISAHYGNITPASVAAIQRSLMTLESQGGKQLLGEPALNILDVIKTAPNGHGAINILNAETLMQSPKLYSTLLLWLLSELFENMPEAGDLDKPKLVFFFDEAHLLFNDAPKALVEKIEQLVRLIRSKGVGVYFITQNPADIPDTVLGQLSNRVQHALRAYTPKDQKGVRAAAETFRVNPKFKTETAITELAVGEALVSMLDAKGVPTMVERVLIRPPLSRVGPITPAERATAIQQSPLAGVYDAAVNRESAYERLQGKVEAAQAQNSGSIWGTLATAAGVSQPAVGNGSVGGKADYMRSVPKKGGRQPDSAIEIIGKSILRSAGSSAGRQIARGLLGALLK